MLPSHIRTAGSVQDTPLWTQLRDIAPGKAVGDVSCSWDLATSTGNTEGVAGFRHWRNKPADRSCSVSLSLFLTDPLCPFYKLVKKQKQNAPMCCSDIGFSDCFCPVRKHMLGEIPQLTTHRHLHLTCQISFTILF